MLAEMEPGEQPEYLVSDYCQAFDEYFEGLVLEDIVQVRSAGAVIRTLGTVYSHSVDTNATRFEALCFDGIQDSPEQLQKILEVAIKANVYSGIPINPGPLQMAAELLGGDQKWLRDVVRPEARRLDLASRGNKQVKAELRDYSNIALRTLGFTPWRVWLNAFIKG